MQYGMSFVYTHQVLQEYILFIFFFALCIVIQLYDVKQKTHTLLH